MIYFVETNQQSAKPADLAAWGLSHLLDDGEALASVAVSGACKLGVPGLIVANKSRWGVDCMTADAAWSDPLPGLPVRVRVAWAERPTPESLARKRQLDGWLVKDADGREWRLPLVRSLGDDDTPEPATPRYLKFGPDGELVPGEVKEEWRYLWEATETPWRRLVAMWEAGLSDEGDDPRQRVTDAEVVDWLSPIVAANYAVTARELVAMNTFDADVTPFRWLSLAVSFAQLVRRHQEREAQKKRESAGGSATTNARSDSPLGVAAGA